MGYIIYIDDVLVPVPPSSITTKIKSQNATTNLINLSEINILKPAGLSEMSFSILIPHTNYHFATYESEFQVPKYFFDKFENLKVNQTVFQLMIIRQSSNRTTLPNSNMTVTLENYNITEDAGELGLDFQVDLNFKQFVCYGKYKCTTPTTPTSITSATSTATSISSDVADTTTNVLSTSSTLESNINIEEIRYSQTTPEPTTTTTYTVQSGDCLYNIARKYYNDGAKYIDIFNANSDILTNANRIYPGQVLTIPVL